MTSFGSSFLVPHSGSNRLHPQLELPLSDHLNLRNIKPDDVLMMKHHRSREDLRLTLTVGLDQLLDAVYMESGRMGESDQLSFSGNIVERSAVRIEIVFLLKLRFVNKDKQTVVMYVDFVSVGEKNLFLAFFFPLDHFQRFGHGSNNKVTRSRKILTIFLLVDTSLVGLE